MVLLSLSFDSLHGILRKLYDEMTGLCQPMMTLATAIAALGALFYIAYRVWQSLSRANRWTCSACCVPSAWASASCSST